MVEKIPEFLHVFLGKNIQNEKTAVVVRPGQFIHGKVLQIDGSKAVLLINGVNISAELKISASVGERLLLYVEEQKPDGTLVLKKISTETAGKIIEGKAEALLNHLGIKASRLNILLVEKMLQRGISFSASDLSVLEAFMGSNSLTEEHVPAVLWLWSRNLPLSKEAVEAVHSFLSRGQGAVDEKAAVQLLGSSKSFSNAENSLGHLISLLKNVFIKEDENAGKIAQKLSSLAENLGLNHEREIFELALLDKRGAFKTGNYAEAENLVNGKEAVKTFSLKGEILRILHASLAGKEEGKAVSGEFFKEIFNNITALQLLNLSEQQDSDGFNLFLQGWVYSFEGKISPFFLKLKRFNIEEEKKGDFSCQVLFFITKKYLGEVMCRLVLEKGHLTCSFTVEQEKYKEIIDSNVAILESKLKDLPWKLIIYNTRVSSQELRENFDKEILEAGSIRNSSLDTRV
ncbi:MAG TPA: hypothetical protein DEA47_05560 [Peptococcaceae bacterium]|nr:MAG: hypothetical protein XD50_0742 [Clostridia bacterium 41_269]HBT20809.1 hypothetical protein [Peptococcaceae bacterium]